MRRGWTALTRQFTKGRKRVTLIFATVEKQDILVTADGLSVSTELGHASGRATLQKIFASLSRPVAIAQCGKNFVDVHCQRAEKREHSQKKSFGEWLSVFFQRCDFNDIASIARSVRDSIQLDNPRFFDDGDGSHLWVLGFSEGSNRPEFYLLGKNGIRDLLEGEALPFKTCTGAGAQFLNDCEWQNHDEAFQRALEKQGERQKPEFGGQMHRLRITPAGCGWTDRHAPLRGTLGLEMTLSRWEPTVSSVEDSNSPRCRILFARDELLRRLTQWFEPNRKRPRTYGHLRDKLSRSSFNYINLTDQLIAVYDDAELANPADVSPEDARLYAALVQQIIDSSPPDLQPSR
jgi:hypothetical protein